MSKTILLATNNAGKAKELQEAFEGLGGVTFVMLSDYDEMPEPVEDGATFEANAMIKARYYGEALGLPALADDSGFILEAYPDKFGIHTRRELDAKDDMDWMTQFIDLIEPLENKRAIFYCAMAFYDPHTKTEKIFLGQTAGEMMDFPQTPLEPGIPVSSIFLPDGQSDVFSAMSKHQKNEVSHRGKACSGMRQHLTKALES